MEGDTEPYGEYQMKNTGIAFLVGALLFFSAGSTDAATLDPVVVATPAMADVTPASVKLNWNQTTTAAKDFKCYRILRSTTRGLANNVIESLSNATADNLVLSECIAGDKTTVTYTDTTVDSNTTYYYKVYVFDQNMTYTASANEVMALTVPQNSTVCAAPTEPDTSTPTYTVGDGTAESCTEAAFKSAVAWGGIINFNCGPGLVTITLTSKANVSTTVDTIIDGNHKVVLSGGGTTRILELETNNFELTTPTLTVMNMTFRDASSTGQLLYNNDGVYLGYHYDAGGGAIYYHGGNVKVFNSTFINNKCPGWGPDLAGGGIYGVGDGVTTIVNSHFENNSCANGGAIGGLHTSIWVYNTIIYKNTAIGKGANYQDANDVQQGHGGNGGGILMDGDYQDFLLCGSSVINNTANSLGGGMFRTTYSGTGTMIINKSIIDSNYVTAKDDPNDSNESANAGGVYFQGGPITVRDSTISRNSCPSVGGAFQLEYDQTTMTFENVKMINNQTRSGIGGALWIATGITGTINNSTISYNKATSDVSFAAASAGGGESGVTLSNTKILYNSAGNQWNPVSCMNQFKEGGGNYQYPVVWANNNGSDNPDYLCSSSITIADPG